MNVFIGIDFSKEKFNVAILFKEGFKDVAESVSNEFKNSLDGYVAFEKWLKKHHKETDSLLFCGEDTGHYSQALSIFLCVKGYEMWLEDPYTLKHSMGLLRVKSDKADAIMIAEYAMRNQDKKRLFKVKDNTISNLRELLKARDFFVGERTRITVRKNEQKAALKEEMKVRRHLNIEPDDSIFSMIDKCMADDLKCVEKKIEKIEKAILDQIEMCPEIQRNYGIITSIKGIGMVNAVAIIICTDNFRRFDFNSRKICCYYGVAPFGHTSGSSVNGRPHTSFFANKKLKSVLGMAAQSAKVHCPVLAVYYKRQVERKKHPMVISNNIKNKLLHMIVSMVKNGNAYDDNYLYKVRKKFNSGKAA